MVPSINLLGHREPLAAAAALEFLRTDVRAVRQGTLLGLLAAYNYEAGILAAAARLLCGDAARDLTAAYRSRLRARPAAFSAAATTAASSSLPTADDSRSPSQPPGGSGGSSAGAVAPARMATGVSAGGGGSGGGGDDMRKKLALLELFDTRGGAAGARRSRTRMH